MKPKVYALYRGEDYIDTGTLLRLSTKHGINLNTLRWLTTPVAKRRVRGKRGWSVTLMEDEE